MEQKKLNKALENWPIENFQSAMNLSDTDIEELSLILEAARHAAPAERQAAGEGVEDKAFIRGFACCLSNAISLESWHPHDIGGGFKMADFEKAGVDERDLKIIRGAK